MKLEEIESNWAADSVIDQNKLGHEAARVPVLHSKYYSILFQELFRSKEIEQELAEMTRLRHLYYTDVLTDEELKRLGWNRIDHKPLRADLEKYMSADKELAKLKMRWFLQDEKVTFLKSILNTINSRGFLIKSMIEWKKFEAGG